MASRPLQVAAALGQKLRQGKLSNGFRVSDVYLQGWPGLDTEERARVALRVLVDAGWVRLRRVAVDGEIGGAGEQYMVNPRIYGDSARARENELAGAY
jgi:hypothetical protein